MSHWMIEALGLTRAEALREAARVKILGELALDRQDTNELLIESAAQALETAVMDLLLAGTAKGEEQLRTTRTCAADAYRLYQALSPKPDALQNAELRLRASALAVLGDLGADAARHLREEGWPPLRLESEQWHERTLSTIIDVWLRLIRKQGWPDRDAVLDGVARLRASQNAFEAEYLSDLDASQSKGAALELVTLYHLAKAAEILALYITDGAVEGHFQINSLLDMHFDRAIAACALTHNASLEPLARLLAAAARQLAENAIWTVTRAVNSRVTKFVQSLVNRGRGNQAIFDVLPPQRRALAEQGLLGSSRRAVVVSLPTSSGKTLIAQFRILQALNQYDDQKGWVAYLAPTRTLVRQVARRLRRDFEPLGVAVEQVSPALEIDGVEAQLLNDRSDDEFRVLVTTPEKLDLMLRQGWEKKIGRPLTLVVVDEAHNIEEGARGLKLELLLATINAECQNAQFLLLTPFINNAREVARWLGDANSDDISLSMDWQPNDRVIGVVKPEKGEALSRRSNSCHLVMETVHTTRATLAIDDTVVLADATHCGGTFSEMSNTAEVAAATARKLAERGPVIVMHSRPDFVWSLAEKIKEKVAHKAGPSERIQLVQDFLKLEMGDEFPLIDLLSYRIGVHHAGLSDDTRALMEWLFENEELSFLVATTTIAQGVNFPVSGVVMAANTYFQRGAGPVEMPAADFWNVAGRAGRVDQGSLGVIALAAANDERARALKTFINKQTGDLNSSLVRLVSEAGDLIGDLGAIVYHKPEWSAFLQYLTHTYQQMGKPEAFADDVERVLRGTFGFGKLRSSDPMRANRLLEGIRSYSNYFTRPNQPLKLVDSTGFSLQSIKSAMVAANEQGISSQSWNANALFGYQSNDLQKMMGVLLKVPELRDNLSEVTGKNTTDGQKLALILKDWVNGKTLPEIAECHFKNDKRDEITALTVCGQNLFGKLTQTAAWGLGALLSITGGELKDEERQDLNNLASRAFYGVSTDAAITLRLLGVPRLAAGPLSKHLHDPENHSVAYVRKTLRASVPATWTDALGQRTGVVYHRVWRILEGMD
ncbi:DEAD/DEAH box helicase [Dyella subtropica]|uniref:DEAD/DEAH box helicase n=1 Tax=Dyella subtropica TaxID=2992127 RepID=UPI002252A576|nr:DEAD/DEAH box helicase [Dyella subtropica]